MITILSGVKAVAEGAVGAVQVRFPNAISDAT